MARLYCEEADWPEESEHLLVFVFETAMTNREFSGIAGSHVAAVPELAVRPSDLAGYARRFARLACDRNGQKDCDVMPEEAVMAILSYAWPGNYREVQTALTEAVNVSELEPLSLDSLYAATNYNPDTSIPPNARLGHFVQRYQASVLTHELSELGGDLSKLVKEYKLEGAPSSPEGLAAMQLIEPSLGEIKS